MHALDDRVLPPLPQEPLDVVGEVDTHFPALAVDWPQVRAYLAAALAAPP